MKLTSTFSVLAVVALLISGCAKDDEVARDFSKFPVISYDPAQLKSEYTMNDSITLSITVTDQGKGKIESFKLTLHSDSTSLSNNGPYVEQTLVPSASSFTYVLKDKVSTVIEKTRSYIPPSTTKTVALRFFTNHENAEENGFIYTVNPIFIKIKN
ncbi:hypothetical protein QNI16_20835 [Cytophagaceae bacterium YF14B1]|uniref:DUF1735 domain-containing protein n=1 Tax=Xanthocytophaga flava TaxID=3048013 RepID=A0AAE3QQD0_9BACT|nr:hypothetical protein [Xanthocytophaga flavus]MDJ1482961.1 hypothetical protein [Xanthocytophaga flavus]